MKLKVTLERAGQGMQDLLITCDAATTVGDLAAYLAESDPTRTGPHGSDGPVTLGLVRGGRAALDPRTPLADSPIRSGAVVSVTRSGSSYQDDSRSAAAILTVVAGPDAGRTFELTSGTNIIGRVRSCEVRLGDPLVSRQHARVNVSDHIEVVDMGSANGLELNGALISREVVRPTDEVRVGDSVFTVRLARVASAEGRTDSASVGFIRSPRLAPRFEGRDLECPELPQEQHKQPFPMVMLIAPLMMAGVMYWTTKQAASLTFALLSPLMMLGNYFEQRRHQKRGSKAALAAFRADLADLVAEGEQLAMREVAMRLAEHPATTECIDAITNRTPLLWTRRPGDWGFLELRLGTGTLPTRSTIKLPDARRGPRPLYREAVDALSHLDTVHGVPVVAAPRANGGLGIAGARGAALSAARALVVQAAALHSPAELAIAILASSRSVGEWDWAKWLPHVDSPQSPVEAGHLAANPNDASAMLTAVESVIATRGKERGDAPKLPEVLLVIESDAPADFGRLVDISERGWRAGIHVLWVAPEVGQLPAACRTFVDTTSLVESGVGYVHDAAAVHPVVTEVLSADDAARAARILAPLVDLGARSDDATDLPRRISFLALDGHERLADEPESVLERWQQNHSILTGPYAGEPARREASLRAVVGAAAGNLHSVDLRADGPHALVGGTTGAGKSELLQTWILSMAASHSPQRLSFLLVDYKGGSAFADCSRLPHTVGIVTDLNPNGVRRALTSLGAELRYREEFLHARKAKDLMALEKRADPEAPPSLVIVVDEFAALVQEVPEFVDGVVNVAQRGRSLGLHLVLATQRPAGVIKDNLRANTNLRMALRVADEGDSTDVLGSPDAAFFDPDLPGRAVSKTGPGRLVPFQTAYVGGHTSAQVSVAPDIRVQELAIGSRVVWELPEAALPKNEGPTGPTDIARVVDQIGNAVGIAGIPLPRKPWLPDLRVAYNIKSAEVASSGRDDRLVFGVADEPEAQRQVPVAFHPDRDGNMAIFGAGGSGKSTMLRTLAVAAGLAGGAGPCHIYALDFGARGLDMLKQLPHVGAVINAGDDERIRRLIGWLRELVDERAQRYAAVNADSVTAYRTVTGIRDEPRIMVLLDGLAAFRKSYEDGWQSAWYDRLVSIAADGRPVGVHLVVTADRPGALPTQLAATIQRRLVLRMADPGDYGDMGAPSDILNPTSPAGRAIWGKQEVQVAVLGAGATEDQAPDLGEQSREMAVMARWMTRSGVRPAEPIRSIPERVTLTELPSGSASGFAVGIEGENLGPCLLVPEGTLVVSGPPMSGRTTTVQTVVAAYQRSFPLGSLSYLLTMQKRSALIGACRWTQIGVGVEAGRELARQVTEALVAHVDRTDEPVRMVFVVEGFAEWASAAESMLVDLFKAADAAGALMVTDGEPTHFTSRYGVQAAAKGSRTALLLAPQPDDGDPYGAQLPRRINKADFPPGRAYLARGGKALLVQLATVGGG